MSLQPITGQAFYLPGANNLGVVANSSGEAIAIDTGIDKDSGRALRKALDAAGLRLRAIISTHHHADHVGGNEFLLRNIPGVEVWAPPFEAELIRNPELEPIYLYGGARPIAALRGKWLLSKGSPVHHLLKGEQATIAGIAFDLVPVPGHSPAQVAVASEGVCFAADTVFGAEVLARHGVPFGHDIAAQVKSIRRLAATDYAYYVPSHGSLTAHPDLESALIVPNLAAIERTRTALLAALIEPADLPLLVTRLCLTLEHTLAGLPQYYLFSSTVAAYLSWLEADGLVSVALEHGQPCWRLCG